MLVLYGARTGGLAWRPAMARLPGRLASIFPKINLLLVYAAEPHQEQVATVAIGPPAPTVMLDFDDATRTLRP
jgi:hypothetical protein